MAPQLKGLALDALFLVVNSSYLTSVNFPFFLLRITNFSMEMLRVNVFVVFSIYPVSINGHKQTEDFEIYRLILLY